MAFSMNAPVLSTRIAAVPRLTTSRARVQPAMSRRSMVVRAEAPQDVEQAVEKVEEAAASTAATVQEAAYTPTVPQQAPSFGDAMAFSGPAPEIINGRLAMLAFLSASAAELATGAPVATQLREAPILIALTFVAFAVASLVPILKGAKSKAVGPFTPTAELLNGRAAMLGFVLLLSLEWAKGGALF